MIESEDRKLYRFDHKSKVIVVVDSLANFDITATDEFGRKALTAFCSQLGGGVDAKEKSPCEAVVGVSMGLSAVTAETAVPNATIHLYHAPTIPQPGPIDSLTQVRVSGQNLLASALDDLTSLTGPGDVGIDIAEVRGFVNNRAPSFGLYQPAGLDILESRRRIRPIENDGSNGVLTNMRLRTLVQSIPKLDRLMTWLDEQDFSGDRLLNVTETNNGKEYVGLFLW